MSVHSHRAHLGDRFSEGARLLWSALARTRMTREELTRRLGCSRGTVSRWLYGDRKPGLSAANELAALFGIPTSAWEKAPKREFQPPGARAAA